MSPRSHPQHWQAIGGLLLANVFWGLSFPLIKAMVLAFAQVVPNAGDWFVTASVVAPRFGLGALTILLLQCRGAGRIARSEVRQGLWLGATMGAGMLFQTHGLQYTSASVSAFLTQFYAIMIPVWVAFRLRRRPPVTVWICSALVLAGVAILGRFDFRTLHLGRGEAETLLSSVFFMMQILVLGRREFADNRVLPVTMIMFALQFALFAVLAVATAPSASALVAPWRSEPWIAGTLALTLFCTLGSFLLMNKWQPLITTTEAGLIYTAEPVFASVMVLFLPGLFSAWAGFDYPNERLTWHLLLGGGLITVANVLIQLRPAKTK